MTCLKINGAIVCISREFNPGDMPPENAGYNEWCDWAEAQCKAGLKQVRCGLCGRYSFPQELSKRVITTQAITSNGNTVFTTAVVYKKCEHSEKPNP